MSACYDQSGPNIPTLVLDCQGSDAIHVAYHTAHAMVVVSSTDLPKPYCGNAVPLYPGMG